MLNEYSIKRKSKIEHLLIGSVSYGRVRRTEKANSHGINNKSGQNHYSMRAEKYTDIGSQEQTLEMPILR